MLPARPLRYATVALLVAMLANGCGGDGGESADEAAQTRPTTAEAVTTTTHDSAPTVDRVIDLGLRGLGALASLSTGTTAGFAAQVDLARQDFAEAAVLIDASQFADIPGDLAARAQAEFLAVAGAAGAVLGCADTSLAADVVETCAGVIGTVGERFIALGRFMDALASFGSRPPEEVLTMIEEATG